MKVIRYCLLVGFILFDSTSVLFATCSKDCWQYCGVPNGSHGYCVDYVEYRVRARQSGDAGTWTGNICPDDVRRDDVAIFGPTKRNPYPKNSLIDKDSFIIQSNYTYIIS